jgi:hypothetical protein
VPLVLFVRRAKSKTDSTGGNFEGRPAKPGASPDDPAARGRGQSKFAQRVLSAQKQPPAPTLFFGNLGFETTVESIKGVLEAHRAKEKKSETTTTTTMTTTVSSSESANNDGAKDRWIRKIRMGTFEDSGLCKGCVLPDSLHIEIPLLTGEITPGLRLSISRARSTQPLL